MRRDIILMMVSNLPKTSQILARLKEIFLSAEDRLSKMSRRRILLVVVALALGFALLGAVLGIILTPYRPTDTPPLNSNADGQNNPSSSYTGTVRSLSDPIEGAEFYLELENEKRLLLKSTNIDISFFKDASVTVEGVVVGTSDQSEQIIFVNKIRIK